LALETWALLIKALSFHLLGTWLLIRILYCLLLSKLNIIPLKLLGQHLTLPSNLFIGLPSCRFDTTFITIADYR
jgi:hypothetical protein